MIFILSPKKYTKYKFKETQNPTLFSINSQTITFSIVIMIIFYSLYQRIRDPYKLILDRIDS